MTIAEAGKSHRQAVLLATLERLLDLATTTLEDTLEQSAQLISKAIETEKVDIFLLDPSINTLVAVGTSDQPLSGRQRALGLDRLPLANGGVEAYVFETGESFLTGHADQEPLVLRGVVEALGVRSLIEVPLTIGSERRGVLSISSTREDQYDETDLAFMQAASRWIGMLVHRTELIEQITRDEVLAARRMVAEDLINVLAHDVGNLLTPLVGRVYMLLQSAKRDNRTADVANAQSMAQSLQRLQALLDNLLNAERLEHGLFTLAYEACDVVALVQGIADTFRSAEHPIDVRAPEPFIIDADPDRLRQAVENLVTNALKHGATDQPIVISIANEMRSDEPWAVVSVQDFGPGIAPDLLPHLFSRFVRGTDSKGTGLGLYLAHGIAQAHGGSLTVESAAGAGATFTLAIPHRAPTIYADPAPRV